MAYFTLSSSSVGNNEVIPVTRSALILCNEIHVGTSIVAGSSGYSIMRYCNSRIVELPCLVDL